MNNLKTKLDYSIFDCSGHAVSNPPHNIKVNKPNDLCSRWYTDSISHNHFITIKLHKPAVVESVMFGKYIKPHVSNIKRFSLYGGMELNAMVILLAGGLSNNSKAETFKLNSKTCNGVNIPVLYITINVHESFGPAFNYSIWYLELHGINDEAFLDEVIYGYNVSKEEEALRIIMKHFRRKQYTESFKALQRETGIILEGEVPAKLWIALVEKGDYLKTERVFEEAIEDGELDWYLSRQPYKPIWKCISPCSKQVEDCLTQSRNIEHLPILHNVPDVISVDRDWPTQTSSGNDEESSEMSVDMEPDYPCKPGPRGGHQLIAHPTEGALYLFGGWDGTEDLDDLWKYDLSSNKWFLLSAYASHEGGPSPRSCHKMVLDSNTNKIFTFGRYLDAPFRKPDNMKSDFYMYDITSGEWSCISEDSSNEGGPGLIFDHQMCLDPQTNTIYIFGGRLLPKSMEESFIGPSYSGLYAYYINTNNWEQICDSENSAAPKPRFGHSMVFHPTERSLYILGGQRKKEHLMDMWRFNVESRKWQPLTLPLESGSLVQPGFTQRATLDVEKNHMLVISGLKKECERKVCNSLWVYSLSRCAWNYVLNSEGRETPPPRFAHQLVYDPVSKLHYLFGGNPGINGKPKARLDDLWTLELESYPKDTVLAQVRSLLREAHFRSIAEAASENEELGPSVAAVKYLWDELHPTIDHSDGKQSEKFRRLPLSLFEGRTRSLHSYNVKLTPAMCQALSRQRRRIADCREVTTDFKAACSGDTPLDTQDYMQFKEAPSSLWNCDNSRPDQPPADIYEAPDEDQAPSFQTRCHQDEERSRKIALFDELAKYFPPTTVHPEADVHQLVFSSKK